MWLLWLTGLCPAQLTVQTGHLTSRRSHGPLSSAFLLHTTPSTPRLNHSQAPHPLLPPVSFTHCVPCSKMLFPTLSQIHSYSSFKTQLRCFLVHQVLLEPPDSQRLLLRGPAFSPTAALTPRLGDSKRHRTAWTTVSTRTPHSVSAVTTHAIR